MKVYKDLSITKNKEGEYWYNYGSSKTWFLTPAYSTDDRTIRQHIIRLYRYACKRTYKASTYLFEAEYSQLMTKLHNTATMYNIDDEQTNETVEEPQVKSNETIAEEICTKLINFFSEFSFEPNFRFINTLARVKQATDYIDNYFKLTDNSYAMNIHEKMKSAEFQDIVQQLSTFTTNKQINKRFKLYYGSQGTGKTTQAMIEANNNVMVCHSAMLPSDLMEDFKFDDGKAAFTPSALCNAMTEGKTIVLDEINLLPFESLRFLQSILDGKSQIIYKGKTIEIKDGFKIIGTMNLQVNGMTYSLPEPLVDRAEDLVEFKLTADKLIGALI